MRDIYLGKTADGKRFSLDPDTLQRHIVVFGATGSGKTTLCKAIVEGLAMAGYPILAIDPKGDVSGLAIASENLEFRPWCDAEAEERGLSPEEYSEILKNKYLDELKRWGLYPEALKEYVENVEVVIYTPRGSYGLPLSVSPSLDPIPNIEKLIEEDPSVVYDALSGVASLLLQLAGYTGENREEQAFLAEIIRRHWFEGEQLTLEDLIDEVLKPPFSKIGKMNINDFLSSKERKKLARSLNVLISHPSYQSWVMGEKLDFERFFGKSGRISVIDLRFMSSLEERQAFLGILFQELYRWLIRKGGFAGLRYMLYFDEIVGYVPPVGNPPSKDTLMLLVKQGRAFGLGLLLATQNPVDVDYKVLSNANHRFIGRLSAKQDALKIKSGLNLDGESLEIIYGLKPRTFLYHNYDKGITEIVSTRWLISYHRGPLSPSEIKKLTSRHVGKKEMFKKNLVGNPDKVNNLDSKQLCEQVIPIKSEDNRVRDENAFKNTIVNSYWSNRNRVEPVRVHSDRVILKPGYMVEEVSKIIGGEIVEVTALICKLLVLKTKLNLELDGIGPILDSREFEIVIGPEGVEELPKVELVSEEDLGLNVSYKGEESYSLDERTLNEIVATTIYYSPLVKEWCFEEGLEELREKIRETILEMRMKEAEQLKLESEFKKKTLSQKRPLIVAQMKMVKTDLKTAKRREERLRKLSASLKKKRLRTGEVAIELRRASAERKKLEARYRKLSLELEMLDEEIKNIDRLYKEKLSALERKYEELKASAIEKVKVFPVVEIVKEMDVALLHYMFKISRRNWDLTVRVDPYRGIVHYGKCGDCGSDVVAYLEELRKKPAPVCSICGAPLCQKHLKTCSKCGNVICSNHAVKCVNIKGYACSEHVVWKKRFFRKVPYCS